MFEKCKTNKKLPIHWTSSIKSRNEYLLDKQTTSIIFQCTFYPLVFISQLNIAKRIYLLICKVLEQHQLPTSSTQV